MTIETDYSQRRSIVDEPHWNAFVPSVGGELVAPLIKRPGVKNADYIFRDVKVVAELKVLETEFAHTPGILARIGALVERSSAMHPSDLDPAFYQEFFRILKVPFQRIINKANRQIKETKRELALAGFRGMIICINDNFRGVRPHIATGLLGRILDGKSYSSTHCLIYQTNHYVEIQESPDACLLWAPMYSPKASDDLVEFVNNLGRAWRKYVAELDGPFDSSEEVSQVDWDRGHIVGGPLRHERFVGPKS
jgi:hypothetical protein